MKDEPLDYAFLDVKLRGMTGVELAKRLREEKPKVKIIFCTAYSDYAMDAFSGSCSRISAETNHTGNDPEDTGRIEYAVDAGKNRSITGCISIRSGILWRLWIIRI